MASEKTDHICVPISRLHKTHSMTKLVKHMSNTLIQMSIFADSFTAELVAIPVCAYTLTQWFSIFHAVDPEHVLNI